MHAITSKRNEYADLLKGLLIFGVLTEHSGAAIAVPNMARIGVIWYNMLPWIMPLFMAISGYFFYFSAKKRSIKELFYNKVLCLLIPTIVWNYVGKFVYILMTLHKPFCMNSWWPGGYWFLWSAMVCILLTMLIHYVGCISNRKIEFFFAGLICVCLHFIPEKSYHFAYMFVFFYGGYICNRFSLLSIFKPIHYVAFLIVAITCWLFSTYSGYAADWYQWTSGCYVLGPRGWKYHLFYNLYRDAMGIMGSIGYAGVIFLLWNGKLQRIRNYPFISHILRLFLTLGKYSLAIYLIQGVLVEIVLWRIVGTLAYHCGGNILTEYPLIFKWFMAPAAAIVMGLLCLGIMQIILRYQMLRQIFLGNLR